MRSETLDRRVNAWREDLAAEALRGKADAPVFVEGEARHVVAASAPLRREPRADAPLDTEVLRGQTAIVYDEKDGWAWVQMDADSYVGYVPSDALSPDIRPVTHRVTSLRTYVFPVPGFKVPPLDLLSLNAAVAVSGEEKRFLALESGGFVIASHLTPVSETAKDFVSVAEMFLGTPYLWGGRTSIGVDCSGLVQLSLEAAGIPAPRDSDMQEQALGSALPDKDFPMALRRGDIVFWKGHVGIMCDEKRLVHANAFHMQTVIEPFAAALKRIDESGTRISSVRRLEGAAS